ncbi:Putative ribonuclease H protein At1g65750 [Linum perenne]
MMDRTHQGLVNHILYADDALLFCEASDAQVRHLAATLICFERVIGLKVNFHKSAVFAVGEVVNLSRFATTFGCQVDSFPTSYHGLPLGAKCFGAKLWDPVVRRVENKLESWKCRFLSFGGRLVLIKSVLSSLPVYFLSLLRAQASVILKLERIQNKFLWAGTEVKDKIHWVSWDLEKTPRERGGLGIQDLKILNSALLCKWFWRFAIEKGAWWRSLLVIKCGEGSSEWLPVWNFSSAGCSMWRWVVQLCPLFWSFGYLNPGGGGGGGGGDV